jgi:hypothetical protein
VSVNYKKDAPEHLGGVRPFAGKETLDPGAAPTLARRNRRGQTHLVEELHRRKVKAGESFGAAYVVGWFDDVAEMEKVYDRYKGKRAIVVEEEKFRLE